MYLQIHPSMYASMHVHMNACILPIHFIYAFIYACMFICTPISLFIYPAANRRSWSYNQFSHPLYRIINQQKVEFSFYLTTSRADTVQRWGKNQNKHMQELGFKHPTKINLSAVIALTRGFLMLFNVFQRRKNMQSEF